MAQAMVRMAGWVYRAKKDEWWADIIYFQHQENEAGLLIASLCLISAPALAWPHLSLVLTAWLMAAIADSGSRFVTFSRRLLLQCALRSPQALAVGVCSLIGLLSPINGLPDSIRILILAPVGVFIGTSAPKIFLGVFGAAAGALVGLQTGMVLGGGRSAPLFAGVGMLIGEKVGFSWADQVGALKRASLRASLGKRVVVPGSANRPTDQPAMTWRERLPFNVKVPRLVVFVGALLAAMVAVAQSRVPKKPASQPTQNQQRVAAFHHATLTARDGAILMPIPVVVPETDSARARPGAVRSSKSRDVRRTSGLAVQRGRSSKKPSKPPGRQDGRPTQRKPRAGR